MPVTTYVYNRLGDRVSTTQTSGDISRIQSSDSAFVYENGIIQQTSISVASCSDLTIPAMTNAASTRLYPLENGLLAESRSRDMRGNETVQTVTRNPTTLVTTTTVTSPASTLPATSVSLAGLTLSQTDQHGCTTTYGYDTLMRQINAETRSGPNNERLTGTYTHYNVIGQVDYTEDAFGTRTTYIYDSVGRKVAQTFLSAIDSLSNSTYTAYDSANRTLATWGATYPVAYEYDNAGRMTAMYTYRGTNEAEFVSQIRQSGNEAIRQFSDRTQWLYDQATGLLTNKLYADGKGPSYSYTALGQLSTRKWARLSTDNCPLITDYSYNAFGSLTNTAYSDGTPSVSFTYDSMGRQKVTQTFLSATGEIISCTTNIYSGLDLVAEIQNGVRIDRQVDAFGRPSGISIGQDYAVEYGFNKYGQFSSVKSVKSAETNLFTYSYLPGSHLIASVDHPSYTARKTYENSRDLITTVSNTFGTATISAFNYENDGLGRRTARTDTTPTLTVNNAFGYNLKSEVTSATMANGDSKYDYDPIGNRVFSSLNAETNTYSANALNQYSSLQPKDLQPINLSYDLDGNMLTNGVWSYSWDAENRLTAVYSNNTLLVSNIYDHQSRRIAKIVSHGGTETQRRDFVYDGWNLIQELITDNGSLTTNFFTWGLDLSGTLQGAGGVGGLLAVTRDSAAFFPCFDANGNVTEYIDATGAIKAHYAFDAFGNTIAQSGALASTFTHRFSTKYFDPETGLYYYGYRFYMPQLGRWLSRDPIGTPGMREWFKNQLRTQSEMQQVLDEISNAEGAVLNKSGGDPKTINALNQYFSVLRQNAVLSSKIWAFPEADPAFTHLYHFCSNDSINRQDSLGEISWLVQGGISVGLGYALAKITDQPYDWKDVAIDFGMGALGPGLLANAKKLATAGKCVKVAGNITVTTKRIAQVIDTVNNRGIVEKAATAVFDARKMQVKLMIEADNKIWEASVGMTSVTARYTGKKLLHGINQASYSETMDASFEYETKGDGNYKLNSTETAPKIEANNWDIEHVDGSLMEIRP